MTVIFFINTGLKLHGVLDLLREHPMEARKFLTNTASISAEDICKFYLFSFSEKDSENRQIEEKIEYNFRRLLSQIESMFHDLKVYFLFLWPHMECIGTNVHL